MKSYSTFSFTMSYMAGGTQQGDRPFSILQGVTVRQWTVLYTRSYVLALVCRVLQNRTRMICIYSAGAS